MNWQINIRQNIKFWKIDFFLIRNSTKICLLSQLCLKFVFNKTFFYESFEKWSFLKFIYSIEKLSNTLLYFVQNFVQFKFFQTLNIFSKICVFFPILTFWKKFFQFLFSQKLYPFQIFQKLIIVSSFNLYKNSFVLKLENTYDWKIVWALVSWHRIF